MSGTFPLFDVDGGRGCEDRAKHGPDQVHDGAISNYRGQALVEHNRATMQALSASMGEGVGRGHTGLRWHIELGRRVKIRGIETGAGRFLNSTFQDVAERTGSSLSSVTTSDQHAGPSGSAESRCSTRLQSPGSSRQDSWSTATCFQSVFSRPALDVRWLLTASDCVVVQCLCSFGQPTVGTLYSFPL